MQIKKGQSLVEVVVALSILAIVFAATVTLIVQVVNLELSARNRTEAVAIAQRYLSRNIKALSCNCVLDSSLLVQDEEVDDGYDITSTAIYLADDIITEVESSAAKFVKVSIAVTWSDKGLPNETYELSQIMRLKR